MAIFWWTFQQYVVAIKEALQQARLNIESISPSMHGLFFFLNSSSLPN